MPNGKLHVHIIEARDVGATADTKPFLRMRLGEAVASTKAADNGGQHASWNQDVVFEIKGDCGTLKARVYDKAAKDKDDYISSFDLDVSRVAASGQATDQWVPLTLKQGGTRGQAHLRVSWVPDGAAFTPPAGAVSAIPLSVVNAMPPAGAAPPAGGPAPYPPAPGGAPAPYPPAPGGQPGLPYGAAPPPYPPAPGQAPPPGGYPQGYPPAGPPPPGYPAPGAPGGEGDRYYGGYQQPGYGYQQPGYGYHQPPPAYGYAQPHYAPPVPYGVPVAAPMYAPVVAAPMPMAAPMYGGYGRPGWGRPGLGTGLALGLGAGMMFGHSFSYGWGWGGGWSWS
eukprot:tig00001278_g7989.t1